MKELKECYMYICRRIVSSFSLTWKWRRELTEEKRGLSKHAMKVDVKPGGLITSLNSKNKSLQVIEEQCEHLVLTWQDMNNLEAAKGGGSIK